MTNFHRPKILIVHSTLHIGGAEEVTATLCRHIDAARFDVVVCCLKENGMVGEKIAAEGTEVFTIPHSRRFKADYFTSLALCGAVRKRQIRLLHSHDVHALSDTTICRLMTSDTRTVHTFHYGGYPSRDKTARTIESLCWRFVDQPVAVSSIQKDKISDFYRIPKGRLAVIRNGVDRQASGTEPLFIRQYREQGKTIIGCINTLIEQKGMFHLLETAALLKRQGLKDHVFLVAGEGHLRPALEERRHALGVDEDVIFLGWIQDAPRVMMNHIDIFFQPSLWEAMSMVLLEAMAAGRAIVATRVGEAPLVIQNEMSGLLVDTGDVASMASAITRLLTNSGLRALLGAAAAKRYQSEFTAQVMANNYMELYDNVLARRKRNRFALWYKPA